MPRLRASVVIAVALALGLIPSASGGGSPKRGPHRDDKPAPREKEDARGQNTGDTDDDEADASERSGTAGLERQPIAGRGGPRIRYVPGELLVRFRAGTSAAEMEAAAARAEGTLARHIPELGVHVVKAPPEQTQQAMASLGSEPAVVSVERDVFLAALDTIPNDALWPTQWGWRLVGAPRAWDTTTGAGGVVIAVLDTGLDAHHPDLLGATVPGADLVNGDVDPSDDEGHGTSVAGVIAARTNNDEGQAGVCWMCSLMPVKVMDSTGSGKTSTIAAGIAWSVDHGARILNMSFGGPGTTSALSAAVGYAASKGAVLVAAAGNSGAATPFYPAAYTDVIGVAGTDESDLRYSWSNYGDWVRVAAPGCNTAPKRGGGYVEFCGTSAAAPVVAGIAGLAIALKPAASRAEVDSAITQSGTPVPGVARFGRVNAPTVVTSLAGPGASVPRQASPRPPPAASAVAAPAEVTAPRNATRPRLRGRARVGSTMRVIPGSWSPIGVRLAFQWRRCRPNGGGCRTIRGAAARGYRLTWRDRGRRLRAVVIAVSAAGASRAVTRASAVIRPRGS